MTNYKIGVIIQARMGSTRLPGKVLKKVFQNDTVIDILIKRLKLSKYLDEIIIATTPDKNNKLIINVAKSHKVSCFIGDEEDVLKRYYDASKKFSQTIDDFVEMVNNVKFQQTDIMNIIQMIAKDQQISKDVVDCIIEKIGELEKQNV